MKNLVSLAGILIEREFDVRDVKKEPTHPKIEVDRAELLLREAGSDGYCIDFLCD
jgi:hypothetical protein